MNEILLYLSLKYNGDWLAVYDSLKAREKINCDDLAKALEVINCTYVSMLDDKYPDGLKSIYKPPFGIFSYGNYDLINNKVIVTIFADINEKNKQYLDFIRSNDGYLLWPNLTNREMIEVLKEYKTNNLFWLPEIKNEGNRTFHHLLEDENIVQNNLFFSELWKKDDTTDYSSQLAERLYLGLTHCVLVLTKLDSKQLLALATYASIEDVKIVIHKDLFEDRMRKLFTKCKVWLIDDKKEILDYFFAEK